VPIIRVAKTRASGGRVQDVSSYRMGRDPCDHLELVALKLGKRLHGRSPKQRRGSLRDTCTSGPLGPRRRNAHRAPDPINTNSYVFVRRLKNGLLRIEHTSFSASDFGARSFLKSIGLAVANRDNRGSYSSSPRRRMVVITNIGRIEKAPADVGKTGADCPASGAGSRGEWAHHPAMGLTYWSSTSLAATQ
jgi:hypothetical protein